MGEPQPPINHGIPGPNKLSLEGNIANNFKRFKRAWQVYEVASQVRNQDPAVRASCMKAYLTEDTQEVLEGLPFTDENHRDNADRILEVLETFCVGTTNETYERYAFFSRNQKAGEPFDSFVGTLRVLLQTCNFGVLADTMLRDKVVIGLCSDSTRRKLLCRADLDLLSCR